MKETIEKYFSDEELEKILQLGSNAEEFLDLPWKNFIKYQFEFSPNIQNHVFRTALERELAEIKLKLSNLDGFQSKCFLESYISDAKIYYDHTVHLNNHEDEALEVLKSIDLNKLFFHIERVDDKHSDLSFKFTKEKDNKKKIFDCLKSLICDPFVPFNFLTIIRTKQEIIWDSLPKEEQIEYKDIKHGINNEDYISHFMRAHFKDIKNTIKSIFIHKNYTWFINQLKDKLNDLNNFSNPGRLKKDTEDIKVNNEEKFEYKVYHVSLVVYLYLRAKGIDIIEIKKDLPRILDSLICKRLDLEDGLIKDLKGRPLNPDDESMKEYTHEILQKIVKINFVQDQRSLNTIETWLKGVKRRGAGFNIYNNPENFSEYSKIIYSLIGELPSEMHSALKEEFEKISPDSKKYFKGS